MINKTVVLTIFGLNLEKNHSAFLLGLRKTVRTTVFYSTLHTEHLPMSHWGSLFFSSCGNLKFHYIFSWFCIFIVTVSTNNLSMIIQLITGALFFIMLLYSSKFKLTNHLIKQKKRMGWKDMWEILNFLPPPFELVWLKIHHLTCCDFVRFLFKIGRGEK